jgi:hypothetical protein
MDELQEWEAVSSALLDWVVDPQAAQCPRPPRRRHSSPGGLLGYMGSLFLPVQAPLQTVWRAAPGWWLYRLEGSLFCQRQTA